MAFWVRILEKPAGIEAAIEGVTEIGLTFNLVEELLFDHFNKLI